MKKIFCLFTALLLILNQQIFASNIPANVKAEDSASADGDNLTPVAAMRQDTPSNTSGTDGDYEPLRVSAGRLWASAKIDTALPAGTNVIGHTINDSGSTTAVTGNVAGTIADAANVTFGAKADAKSSATDSTAITAMQIWKEISFMLQNPASVAVTNAGTFAVQAAITAAINSIADGAIVTLGAKADAKSTATDTTAVTIMQVLKEISALEQAPASQAVTNAGTFGVQATLQASSGTDIGKLTANQSVNVNQKGGTALAAADPCEANAQLSQSINISSATTTRLIAPASAKKTYVCGMHLMVSAADNIVIEEGTGGTCGSGTAAVEGDTTTGLSFAANGGIVLPPGPYSHMQTAGTNVDFCFKTSSTAQVTGTVKYVQAA